MITLIKESDQLKMPWKNGLGITREVISRPASDGSGGFDWRISLATVGASGRFSIFAGIDRTIAVLQGDGMQLTVDGRREPPLLVESPPFAFSGDAEARAAFLAALTKFGLCATQGGRFLTLSKGATKADQIASLTAQLAPRARTMALGDAPNDLAMLMACDMGVIIPNPAHSGLTETAAPNLLRAPKAGPEGWAISVLAQLAQRIN